MFEMYEAAGIDTAAEPQAKGKGESWRNCLSRPSPQTLAFLLTLIGIGLRIAIYLENRPFWTDEAQLALNLTDRTFAGLIGRLDYCQAAPVGFLLMEKAMLTAFGDSEYVLRFIPLLAGVLSQVFFLQLAKKLLQPGAVPIAVALFALSEALLRYSSELKPYSLDVLVSILLMLSGFMILDPSSRRKGLVLLFVGAIVSPWVSYASLLTMIAVLGAALLKYRRERGRQTLACLLMCGFIWVLSSVLMYILSLQPLMNSTCKDALMDFRAAIPHNATAVVWIYRKFQELLLYPFGLSVTGGGIGVLCAVAGGVSFASQRRMHFFVLTVPFALSMVGSWLCIYPLFGRFLLFAVPAFQLLVAEGALSLCRRLTPGSVALAATVILSLFLPRLDWISLSSNSLTVNRIDVRGVIKHVIANRKCGDRIYVYYGGYFPAVYYGRRAGLVREEFQVGVPGYWWNRELREALLAEWRRSNANRTLPAERVFELYGSGNFSAQWSLYEEDIGSLSENARVWIIFSHTVWLGSDEERVFLYFLDKRGKRLQEFKQSGASAYLYDLRCSGKVGGRSR
ncbi:MAG: glycosyltransferase family 39 protein [Candidatus Melainabacteria bacterium]|nr:glycosyltransferase family 39 protein [Candidatus Melainabacteria bacterium]